MSSAQAEDEDQPYVYQKRGGGHRMSGAVQVEVGYGTRATRFFGEEGVESEGGAKVLFGPTAQFLLPHGFDVRLNVSAVYAHLVNQTGVLSAEQARWGLMGRLLLGYAFY